MVLIYYVISEDHVIKGPCDFMGNSPSRSFIILPLWPFMWFYVWNPLIVNYHPTKFGDNRHCGSENVNIPANAVILLQMRDNCYCICPLTATIIIFCKAHDMSCFTRASNINLMNNFYENLF